VNPSLIKHKQHRAALLVTAAIGAAAMFGCAQMNQNRPMSKAALPDAPAMGTEPVAKGVYLAIDRSHPLEGPALERAKLNRKAAVAMIRTRVQASPAPAESQSEAPANSANTATQDPAKSSTAQASPDVSADAEPPPLAVKEYLRGREFFLEGSNTQAMDQLEQALKLDPTAFTVLRLMGRVSFANSQLARGAMYLERAHTMRPTDVEVNYLLGRYWLERNENERAAFYLAQAEDSPQVQITSTQTPLSAFYLGIAFQQAGYHLAAAKEFEHFLEVSSLPVAGYRYDTELSYLISMQWAAHLSAAENFVRAGDVHEALAHYQAAAKDQPQDAFVVSRFVNALMHEDNREAALAQALVFLNNSAGSEDAIRLLAWAYRAAGRENLLIADVSSFLKQTVQAGSSSEQAALILSATQNYLGKKSDAQATLVHYLSHDSRDLKVLARQLQETTTPADMPVAISSSAAAIHADISLTDSVLKLFAPVAEGPAGAAYAGTVPIMDAAPPEAWFLQAITARAHDGAPDFIEDALGRAVKGAPEFFAARSELVSYLVSREKFARANQLVDEAIAKNLGGAKAALLRVQTEAAQQRFSHALELARQAREKFPADPAVRLEVATVYRLRGQDAQADAELQDLINDMPTYEPAYAALVNAWFERTRRGEDPAAGLPVVVGALNRLMREVPNSRFGQITGAVLYARDRRLEEAQNILQVLLATDQDDPTVLVRLAQVRQLLGKIDDARTLLESAMKRKAQPEVAQELAAIDREQNHQAEAVDLLKKQMAAHPDEEGFVIACARELSAQEKQPDAIAVLADASRRLPRSESIAATLAQAQALAGDQKAAVKTWQDFMKAAGETSERLYALTRFTSRAGMDDASVAALEKVLAIMPDHVGANNDLGFFWADAGIHLGQAEPMIKKALENRPGDPAFLDSLGWVYYKEGRFVDARQQLETAVGLPGGAQPEVIQHLGDALYRLGEVSAAQERWRLARQELLGSAGGDAPEDPEEKRVLDYLNKAIDDVAAGRQPALSPLAQPETPRAAGPASAPATAPE